jgi:pyridoxine 4-dehydrogenase
MTSDAVTPASAGTWTLGDLTVNRMGLGAMRLLVDACGDQGIAFVPFFTIAGRGGGRGVTGAEHAEVLAIARAHGATAAQVRLAWALQRGAHVLAIPGTSDPAHLEANWPPARSGSAAKNWPLLKSVTIPA